MRILAIGGLACLAVVTSLPAQNCPGPASWTQDSASWNGWGADVSNSRFQTAKGAQLTARQLPALKLKWAFGLADAKQVFGEPVVAGGRVFFSADTGTVYSLDAKTGCSYWTFQADAGVRTALTVRSATPAPIAYFGDLKGNVYAVDAQKGTLIWKVRADEHSAARITGAPQVFEGRVYVPVASSEEGTSSNPQYP